MKIKIIFALLFCSQYAMRLFAQDNSNAIVFTMKADTTIDQSPPNTDAINPFKDVILSFKNWKKEPQYTISKNNGNKTEESVTIKVGESYIDTIQASSDINTVKYTLDIVNPLDLSQEKKLKSISIQREKNNENDDENQTPEVNKHQNDKEYLRKIKNDFTGFEENEIYQTGSRYHIFLNEYLETINKTKIPDCNKSGSRYTVHIYYKSADSLDAEVTFSQNSNSDALLGGSSLNIESGGVNSQSLGSTDIKEISKDNNTRFTGSVCFDVSLFKPDNPDSANVTKICIVSCSGTYSVSIMAGYNYSSLNNPENVTLKTLPSGDTTLIADNERGQKALTIMAVFYPVPRSTDYRYRDLSFFEKWSICFGSKISQNLFDDLFLGLNYEFAKIGAFTGGIHYGTHKVVAGYDKFKFGKDVYSGTFDTRSSLTTQRDFGLFLGVNIDLRIVEALTFGAKRANALRDNGTDK